MATQHQPPASARVWAIPELAEEIFFGLPPREILVNVQRTCRQWKSVVEASTPLQQVLFFKPVGEALHYNEEEEWSQHDPTKEGISPIGHPLASLIKGYKWVPQPQAFYDPSASWRKQLLTQPPIANCGVFWNARYENVQAIGAGVTVNQLEHRFPLQRDILLFLPELQGWWTWIQDQPRRPEESPEWIEEPARALLKTMMTISESRWAGMPEGAAEED